MGPRQEGSFQAEVRAGDQSFVNQPSLRPYAVDCPVPEHVLRLMFTR